MTLADQLNARLGIEARYTVLAGERRRVPQASLQALWATLAGTGDADPAAILAALDRRAAETPLDPVVVTTQRQRPMEVAFRPLPGATMLRWEIIEEGGAQHRGEARLEDLADIAHGRLAIAASLPHGYHRLELDWMGDKEGSASTTLIVAPHRAFLPACVTGGRRAWGLAVQLYGLRSARNWGIGDFGDLARLIEQAAPSGAAAIGLNPLHGLFPDEPGRNSPYSPSSRLFLNTAYLDVTAMADFAECEAARDLLGQAGFREALAQSRAAPLVDYPAVVGLKHQVLELLYAWFRERHLGAPEDVRGAAFRAFQNVGGAALRRFAAFQALRERFAAGTGAAIPWRRWPAEFHDPNGPAVAALIAEQVERVEFFEYLQWQADLQLTAGAARMAAAGMGIGLYADLAIGFDPDGADAWAGQHYTVAGWSIGAPPDAWNMQGQTWGMPPPHPLRLREQGYAPLIAMLRANMRHAGALRIDHILGLKRLFWIPAGQPPSAGAYVRYPFDDLLSVVALESLRSRCLVVGEDLGTVPPGFSETLQARGMLSYRLLYFARDRAGNFRRPADWPRNALAAVTTHDLPTLTGYWTGRDIELKERLSLYLTPEGAERDRAARAEAQARLAEALAQEGLPVEGDAVPTESVLRFLGRTPCRLAMIQIDDLLDVAEQVNVPGTVEQNPNWQLKLARPLEGLLQEPTVQRRLAALAAERAARGRGEERTAPAAPRATYRLQLNRDFTFDDAASLLPYLAELGISHVYLSPILAAQPGSSHGYDVVDFDHLNPELGGEEGFKRFSAELDRLGLRLLLDFVPNHMGIGAANVWWLDLLEWGPASRHATSFDIDWAPPWPELRGKILLPLLGETYATAVEKGEIGLRFDAARGGFDAWYYDNRFPIRPHDYAAIIGRCDTPAPLAELGDLAQAFAELPAPTRPGNDALYAQADACKATLARLAASDPPIKLWLEAAATAAGPVPGDPERIAAFDGLLERQHWRLAGWRSAAACINYRRFFDINQLAALRMERPEVFEHCHRLIGRLIAAGKLHGLRLDHIDGLADPADYCRRLRRFAERQAGASGSRQPFHILVEKILARHEPLRLDWSIDGTTGYEFANLLNGLYVDPAGEQPLDRVYRDFTGETRGFEEILREAKQQVIEDLFRGDLTRLALRLARLAQRHWRSRDYDAERLRAALKEIAVCLPVYRTYVTPRGAAPEDRREIDGAAERAKAGDADSDPAIYDFLREIMLGELAAREPAYGRSEVSELAGRIQQFTAPLMAKALEDTAFYRHSRLISQNEVGGDPRAFGILLDEFHRRLAERRRQWPNGLLATATHDTKRGEDARTRLDVLSEIPDAWTERVAGWAALNRDKRRTTGEGKAPGRGEEYLIYQTLLGAWPMALVGRATPEPAPMRDFAERVKQYLVKALREAKQQTSWLRPNLAYEAACTDFVDRLLDVAGGNPFLEDVATFLPEIARLGALSSLSQTVLKLTAPGVPDIYQGRELWDFSLVDPDNRRAVDFAARRDMLRDLAARDRQPVGELLESWRDGRIKLRLTADLLGLRRQSPLLFAEGSYEPLEVIGPAADHVVAFARRQGGQALIVAAGRLFARLPAEGGFAPDPPAWQDTMVAVPSAAPSDFTSVFTSEPVEARADGFNLAQLFDPLPVAVLIAGETED
jgi:(1->4)-alpha-D-glucan 1-alpha-D-glucosylmutase